MFKNLKHIKDLQILDRQSQKKIYGRDDGYGECPRPNSFFCGVPGHICCNGLCVLPEHPACGLF